MFIHLSRDLLQTTLAMLKTKARQTQFLKVDIILLNDLKHKGLMWLWMMGLFSLIITGK